MNCLDVFYWFSFVCVVITGAGFTVTYGDKFSSKTCAVWGIGLVLSILMAVTWAFLAF